ncbi:LysE family transporter [Muricoccus pecuniae]|uniref:Threonine/homoserine/homoserine lactone efflux protein n=1 Tax=Muricoccus pecuniae TaxID=693023 RepID=A0A840XVM5_9PROT|nr:LysE family transporter [Roseomonas pecuniae]MBB5692798.1 threonine/homoserine/homoserine lactone efflux protein [Roseomonas pecuniae]
MQDPILFALTVLLILGTPGPTNTLLAAAGGTVGFRRALPLVPAEAGGYLISIHAIGLALGPVIASRPEVALGLRLAVGAYLLLLAAKLWRRGAVDLSTAPVTPRQVFVTTLLNPKAIVFALGVIPFGAERWWPYTLGFLGLLAGVALAWIALGAVLGRAAGAVGRAGLVPRVGAAAVGAFAILLVAGPLLR